MVVIQQRCPTCNTPLRVQEQHAGLSGTCKHCGGRLTITRMFDDRLPTRSPSLQGWSGVFVWLRAHWQTCMLLVVVILAVRFVLDLF